MTNTIARWFTNPDARTWLTPPRGSDVLAFHRTLPGYAATPLRELPGPAAELGVGRLFVKEQAGRLGLPAFKILGASYAISRLSLQAIARRTDLPIAESGHSAGVAPRSAALSTFSGASSAVEPGRGTLRRRLSGVPARR